MQGTLPKVEMSMEGKKGKYLEKNADKEESVLGSNQSIVFNIAVC